MKTYIALIALFSSSLSLNAEAGPKPYQDKAKVISAEPVYELVERRIPEQQCWVETVREETSHSGRKSATPALVGGIIGGVLGNEVGRGSDNKKIGAVVGSVLGMSIAKDIQRRNSTQHVDASYRDIERCETTHRIETERVLEGYNVDYRYHGRVYSTFTREHPGKHLRVSVNVRPIHSR